METDRKILLTDREYPRRLLEIPQAPKQLYVRGKLPEEGVQSVWEGCLAKTGYRLSAVWQGE